MTFEVARTIPGNHPSLPGHFPGAPIVPAVVILDEVLAVLTEWCDRAAPNRISMAKFLAPLKPDQPFTIVLSADEDAKDSCDFLCRAGERIIARGRFESNRQTN